MAELFWPSGRLARMPFAAAAVLVYALGLATQGLLTGPVLVRAGILPFALAHAALLWIWYVIHTNRLRDAGRSRGAALGITIVNVLCMLFVLMLVSLFADPSSGGDPAGNILGTWVVFVFLLALLSGTPALGFFAIFLWFIFVIAILPLLIAVGFSVWAGTRPSVAPVGAVVKS